MADIGDYPGTALFSRLRTGLVGEIFFGPTRVIVTTGDWGGV